MIEPIRQSFEKLQRQKESALSGVSTWSVERLQFRSEPTSWSTLDVLDHLFKVEKSSIHAVRTNLPDGHPVAFKHRIGAWMVIGVMQSPMRIKVPASAKAVLPEGTADLSMITRQWSETREEMAGLLAGLSSKQLGCGLFRHPISGWMTVLQAMKFLSAHLQHHSYQLKRLRQATREL